MWYNEFRMEIDTPVPLHKLKNRCISCAYLQHEVGGIPTPIHNGSRYDLSEGKPPGRSVVNLYTLRCYKNLFHDMFSRFRSSSIPEEEIATCISKCKCPRKLPYTGWYPYKSGESIQIVLQNEHHRIILTWVIIGILVSIIVPLAIRFASSP